MLRTGLTAGFAGCEVWAIDATEPATRAKETTAAAKRRKGKCMGPM
jgi:hypothetical protein